MSAARRAGLEVAWSAPDELFAQIVDHVAATGGRNRLFLQVDGTDEDGDGAAADWSGGDDCDDTTSAVYQVFEGEGYSIIDGQRFDWSPGDLFVVPSWSWHEFGNDSSQEAILFSIQDNPVIKSLALFREEAYEENAGHQSVTGKFSGLQR